MGHRLQQKISCARDNASEHITRRVPRRFAVENQTAYTRQNNGAQSRGAKWATGWGALRRNTRRYKIGTMGTRVRAPARTDRRQRGRATRFTFARLKVAGSRLNSNARSTSPGRDTASGHTRVAPNARWSLTPTFARSCERVHSLNFLRARKLNMAQQTKRFEVASNPTQFPRRQSNRRRVFRSRHFSSGESVACPTGDRSRRARRRPRWAQS